MHQKANNFSQLSFDLWNTVLTSNKVYKQKQVELLSSFFNVAPQEVTQCAHAFKSIVDTLVDLHGIGFTTESIFKSLAKYFKQKKSTQELTDLSVEMNALFLAHPPTVIESTVKSIAALQARGLICNAASNTVFTPGVVLEKVLEHNGIFFNYGVYSDQVVASKPSALFFDEVAKRSLFSRALILHIGDNNNTDGHGALTANMGFKYVANPQETDIFLKEFLK